MSGKSKEEIAFDLVAKLKGVGVWGENNMQQILDMYAECLEATSGQRTLPGRKPVAQAAPAPQRAPVQAPTQAQAPVQTPAPAQPVHQQQQLVQQAYQQPRQG